MSTYTIEYSMSSCGDLRFYCSCSFKHDNGYLVVLMYGKYSAVSSCTCMQSQIFVCQKASVREKDLRFNCSCLFMHDNGYLVVLMYGKILFWSWSTHMQSQIFVREKASVKHSNSKFYCFCSSMHEVSTISEY